MQSSLSMVYDREMGMMRLLLTAPLPRWYLLLAKLIAGTLLSVAQVYAFLIVAWLLDVSFPPLAWLTILPALIAGGLMLGALGLVLFFVLAIWGYDPQRGLVRHVRRPA
jgi:ABC-2 type transport system permease protein